MKNLSQLLKVITLMNKLLNQNTINLSVLISIFFTLILSLIAGFRPLEYFRDAPIYLEIINSMDNIWEMEPTVWLINQINLLFFGGNNQIFFLIYAILGVSIKIFAINRISAFPLLSIYIYICLYFVLHEMTQIRVGVACGIFLLAIPDIVNKNYKNYFIKTIFAMSFHYSAIIMILLYFINAQTINKKLYFVLPILGLALAFIPNLMLNIFNLFEIILPSVISSKITTYLSLINDDDYNKINIFNFFILSLVFFYYFLLFNIDRFEEKIDIVLVKLFGLQLFIYYAFSSIPTFATRLSEFIGIALVITLSHFILMFKPLTVPLFLFFIWLSGYLWFISINRIINF